MLRHNNSLVGWLYSSVFFIMLLAAFCVGGASEALATLSKISFYVCCLFVIFCSLGTLGNGVRYNSNFFYVVFYIFIFWLFLRSGTWYGLGLAIQGFIVMLLAFSFDTIPRKYAYRLCKMIKVSSVFFVFASILHFSGFVIFANNNFWGAYCLFYLLISASLFTGYSKFFMVAVILFFLVVSGTRSALLGLILSVGAWYVVSRKFQVKILIFYAFIVFAIIFYFSGLFDYLVSDQFEDFVVSSTGKRIESGRLDIWITIFSHMKPLDWLIGLGGGFDLESLIGMHLSEHSGYVRILSRYGIVGLLFFIVLIYLSATNLFRNKMTISFILLISFVIREFFEVTLINNNFPLAIMFWGVIASGVIERVQPTKTTHLDDL